MKEYISIHGAQGIVITTTDEARNARDMLLHNSGAVTTIGSNEDSVEAGRVLTELKNFTRLVEASRADAKAPLLEQGRKIDALAKEICAELEAEAKRIAAMLGVWTADQKRRLEEEMRRAQAEATRLIREKEEEETKLRAEHQKELDALEAKARRTKNAELAEKLRAEKVEMERQENEAKAKRDLDAQSRIVQITQTAVQNVGPRPVGISTRTQIKYEVTDMAAFYAAHPYLVTMTVNHAALVAMLKGVPEGKTIPGIKHWSEAVAIAR